jgi:hypothetical protein
MSAVVDAGVVLAVVELKETVYLFGTVVEVNEYTCVAELG